MSSEITVLALAVAAGLLVALALAFRRMQALERQVAAATAPRYAEAERALQQQEAVLKAVDEAVLVLDLQQIVMTANPAAEALFGLAPAGETLIQVVDSPALVELVEAARLVRGEGMERRIEFGPRILHARAVALPGGEDSRVALALRDVTEMQRLERARRELVSNVSHELSTPITAIGLLAEGRYFLRK